MKDSGIEWVGDIPEVWDVFPAGGVFNEVKEKNTNNQYSNPFSFRYGEIVDKKISGEIDESVEETLSAYRVVSPNTIMINGLNLNYDFISQRVAIVKERGIITSAYLAVQPDENRIVPRFVLYLLKAYDYRQVFHGIGSGIRKTLKFQDFKNIKIVAPSLTEQTAIASYLDTQCAKIDEIIAQAKASIEDYKQWKASIIYEAVTKGLDPNVEMKDSGVEGIVEIPNHWRTLRIKYVSSLDAICDTSHISPDDVVTFAPMECIRNDIRIPKVATKSKDNGTYSSFIDGDIAIAKVTPCFENGNICIMDNLENGYAFGSSELFSLRPYGIDRRYFFYCLQTPTFIDGGAATMTGVGGLKRVSSYYMKNALIPIPPLEEQRTIAKFLGKKTALIATLISEKETLIDDLESYKKSLIYETVTGKGRVC